MSWQRILVAVDDSPAGLRAAELAIRLARESGAQLCSLSVVRDGRPSGRFDGDGIRKRSATAHLGEAEAALLRYVADQADEAGVAVDVVQLAGEPFRHILEQARSWDAELIVMGRSGRRGPSSPYLGSVTEHVLEFAECPVLVVPQGSPGGGAAPSQP
jgi:nucleotide-binding universal stress UspA family protein